MRASIGAFPVPVQPGPVREIDRGLQIGARPAQRSDPGARVAVVALNNPSPYCSLLIAPLRCARKPTRSGMAGARVAAGISAAKQWSGDV
jgi:hypothetical protein